VGRDLAPVEQSRRRDSIDTSATEATDDTVLVLAYPVRQLLCVTDVRIPRAGDEQRIQMTQRT